MIGQLIVDGLIVATGRSPGNNRIADLTDHFYLGGVSDRTVITNPAIGPLTPFVGCIFSVSLDGEEVDVLGNVIEGANIVECPRDRCSPNPCANGGTCWTGDGLQDVDGPLCICPPGHRGDFCQGHVCLYPRCLHGGECVVDSNATTGNRCICPATHVGPVCETQVGTTTTPYFYAGNSYIVWHIDGRYILTETFVSMKVYPATVVRPNGLLVLFARRYLDFLAVYIEDGFVKVLVDLGGGFSGITSSIPLPYSQYTDIIVNRKGRDFDLTLNGGSTVSGTARGYNILNVDNRFYVGGVPPYFDSTLPFPLKGLSGFNGCIDEVFVNGRFVTSSGLLTSFNVKHCGVNLCNPSPCKNGATCSSVGNSVICKCPPLFTGPRCEFDYPLCHSFNCSSGSTCLAIDGAAICVCPLRKSGVRCETGEWRASILSIVTTLVYLYP